MLLAQGVGNFYDSDKTTRGPAGTYTAVVDVTGYINHTADASYADNPKAKSRVLSSVGSIEIAEPSITGAPFWYEIGTVLKSLYSPAYGQASVSGCDTSIFPNDTTLADAWEPADCTEADPRTWAYGYQDVRLRLRTLSGYPLKVTLAAITLAFTHFPHRASSLCCDCHTHPGFLTLQCIAVSQSQSLN